MSLSIDFSTPSNHTIVYRSGNKEIKSGMYPIQLSGDFSNSDGFDKTVYEAISRIAAITEEVSVDDVIRELLNDDNIMSQIITSMKNEFGFINDAECYVIISMVENLRELSEKFQNCNSSFLRPAQPLQ